MKKKKCFFLPNNTNNNKHSINTVIKKKKKKHFNSHGCTITHVLLQKYANAYQCRQVTIVEKKTARPFSQLIDQERNNHFITKKENFGFDEQRAKYEMDNKHQTALLNGTAPPHSQPNLDLWFKEVVEMRKKAGEYKVSKII